MHDGHVLLRAASVWVRRKSTLAVAIGGLLALLLWTIPNWETFWQHASQFPCALADPCQPPKYRVSRYRISSPLFIMGMITLALWIFSLVKTEVQEAREPDQVRQPEVITLPADHGQSFSAQVQQQGGPDQGGLFSAQPVQPFSQAPPPPQSAARSPQIDPVTPSPLVTPSTEALRELLTTTGSLEQSGSPQLSQPLTREDESSQMETQAIVPPAPSSSLPLEIVHPVIVAKGRMTAS